MKKAQGLIDSIPITVHIPEDASEYSEGIRAIGGLLSDNEGMLFNFHTPQKLRFENSNVRQDVTILFFYTLLNSEISEIGVVSEIANMKAGSKGAVQSYSPAAVALELSKEFCNSNHIGQGSIFSLTDIEED